VELQPRIVVSPAGQTGEFGKVFLDSYLPEWDAPFMADDDEGGFKTHKGLGYTDDRRDKDDQQKEFSQRKREAEERSEREKREREDSGSSDTQHV
jgi:hypothetical protein